MTNSNMLRGVATLSYFAADVKAARQWYRKLHGAAALGRHIEFTAPLRQILTDVHLTFAVVVGGINEVNAGIKHRIQNSFGLLIAARPPAPDAVAPNFHRAEAKLRHFQTGTSQCSLE